MGIEEVLRELKIDYSVTGKEAVALCPSHKEKKPSWSINLKSGLHHCFSCGFKGTLDSLVAFMLDFSYAQAHMWVAEKTQSSGLVLWRDNKEEKNFAPAYLGVSERELDQFISPPPGKMLWSRGLTAEAAELHGVRWSEENSAWILPMRDPFNGDLWGWQEKRVNDRRYRNYPGGIKKSKTLFGLSAFEYGSTAILVESPLDVVYLSSAGIRGGVSSYGVSVSDCQLSIIHKLAGNIVLALDNDRAGMDETDRLGRDFKQLPLTVFDYGDAIGKDPGELTITELKQGLKNARSILNRRAVGIKRTVGRYRNPD